MVLSNTRKSNKKLSLRRDERGLSTVEYVILLVLMAVAGISLWSTLGGTIVKKISGSNERIEKDLSTDANMPGQTPADDNGG